MITRRNEPDVFTALLNLLESFRLETVFSKGTVDRVHFGTLS